MHAPVDPRELSRCCDRIAHRGPDDSGIWLSESGHVGLAHRRLSIIDISPAGHQPMISNDGRCAIVFNGEIFNFQELRCELEKLGYRFAGGSDTEVVLAAYRAWGTDCVNHFNGMFSFAVYDQGNVNQLPSLFLARDRVGKKPLYYFQNSLRFQFASELKAIDVSTEIDADSINYYLSLGYIPADLCILKGVRKLPPGHIARLDLHDFTLKTWQYWQLPDHTPGKIASGKGLADRVESLLKDAVRLRLVSDVPLGVLLSGGLDSSLIVAAAAHQSSKPVRTFTIALPGSRLDESKYARCVADHFATEHHVLEADKASLEIVDELSPFVDEPLADSSILPAYMVSKLTRQNVTVALGGDGGDELFGGYQHYQTVITDQSRWSWVPRFVNRFTASIAAALPAGTKGRNRIASFREGPLQQQIWGSPYFDINLRKRLFARGCPVFQGKLEAPELWLLSLWDTGFDNIDRMTRMDFKSILPDDFLVKVDRASMAHGLEVRAPFLDYRLVEFAFSSIPSCWKVFDGETRRIQRIIAKRMLPPELDVSRKQGFSIPLDDWLRADRCNKVRDFIPYLPEYLDRTEVDKLIAGELKGRTNGARLFALLMLGIACFNLKSSAG